MRLRSSARLVLNHGLSDIARLSRSALNAWHGFWFQPIDPLMIGLIRLLTGWMLLYNLLVWGLDLDAFFSDHGLQPLSSIRSLHDGDPVFSFWLWTGDQWLWPMHYASVAIAAMFFLGVASRVTSVLSFLITISYSQRVPIANFGFDQVLGFLCLYLSLAPSGACFSVDAIIRRWWRRKHGRSVDVSPSSSARMVSRLIQLHLCAIYLWAGFAKLKGPSWWTGEAMWRVIANQEYQTMDLTWMAHVPWLPYLIAHVTIAWEVFFIVLVWHPRWRPLMLLMGVLMHVGIGAFLGMWTFGLIMAFAYLAFSDPDLWRSRFNRLVRRAPVESAMALAAADSASNVLTASAEKSIPLTSPTPISVSAASTSEETADFSDLPIEESPYENEFLDLNFDSPLETPEVARSPGAEPALVACDSPEVLPESAVANDGFESGDSWFEGEESLLVNDVDDAELQFSSETTATTAAVGNVEPTFQDDDSAEAFEQAFQMATPAVAIAEPDAEPDVEANSELIPELGLPICTDMETASKTRTAPETEATPETMSTEPGHKAGKVTASVCVVAADTADRTAIRRYLRGHEFSCVALPSIDDALTSISRHRFDAVVVHSCGLSSREVVGFCEDVSDLTGHPVVVLLRASQLAAIDHLSQIRGVSWIVLPASLKEIRQQIESVVAMSCRSILQTVTESKPC